ncbi:MULTISPECIES: NAD(P)/FAD-dependent oxidoreductase [Streptomyces]|uniref:NAD(P)/FAD-dependent oxidoreductase n=1 Tax=Streptomyces TaxID=1883 RepID=UPI001A942E78|nr:MULTISPECIES: FAD-dependent oxidoreductase [Streptomyces]MBO0915494.1 NAD(P)/FAD-dependent oxidoreductase [Streptomyces laculatispora]MCX4768153.1 FAD-dependent oxidoreductase [Streptomyces sp. NBC_01285]
MSENDLKHEDGRVWDVAVVGGGVAGLAAALTLARARRSVVVMDAGEPRNAPAVNAGAHGVWVREGISPLKLLRLGCEEIASYGGRLVSGRVTQVHRVGEEFSVVTEDWQRVRARRVLVTTGLVDELPDVPGLAARRGRDVLHCAYCHDGEIRDRAIGVLSSFHQALLFRQVSTDVTLFRHTGADLTDGQWEQLAGLGVGVVDGEVGALEVDDRDRLAGLRLASGAVVPVRKLVVSPRFVARVGFLGGLGLTVREHPMGVGEQVVVDGTGFTGVAGVWAAGNVSDVLAGIPAASAAGVTAAAAINMNLLTTDARRTAAARAAGAEVFSGVMESGVSRRVLGTRVHGLDSLLDNS